MKLTEILAKHQADVSAFVNGQPLTTELEKDLYEFWFESMPHAVYDDASEWLSNKLADYLGLTS